MVRSHTFETRDRIRKIECIKVKAESRARREREQSMAASMAARAYLFQEFIKQSLQEIDTNVMPSKPRGAVHKLRLQDEVGR